jgi:hypothetical protein
MNTATSHPQTLQNCSFLFGCDVTKTNYYAVIGHWWLQEAAGSMQAKDEE